MSLDSTGDGGANVATTVVCKDSNGDDMLCANAVYAGGECTNAMTKLLVRFAFSSFGLTTIDVEAHLTTVTTGDVSQHVIVTFQPATVTFLSGRPGYLMGKPVNIATKTDDIIASITAMRIMGFEQCANMEPFLLSPTTVNFGEDQRIECTYVTPVDPTPGGCTAAQGKLL